jgi:hypothetical protein
MLHIQRRVTIHRFLSAFRGANRLKCYSTRGRPPWDILCALLFRRGTRLEALTS